MGLLEVTIIGHWFISIWPVFWSKGSKLCINIILAVVPAGYEVLTITFSTRKAILKIIAVKRELYNDQLADKIWVIIPPSLISMDGKRRKIAEQQYTFQERKIHSFTFGNFFDSLRVNGAHRFWVNLDVINQSRYLMKESVHIDMWTMLCLTSIKYPLLSEIKNIAAVAFLDVYHTHFSNHELFI